MRLFCMLAVFSLLLSVGQAMAYDIVNGGFEQETPSSIGGFTPDGWTLTGDAYNYWTGGNTALTASIAPHSGAWFGTMANEPGDFSGFEQSVTTVAGNQYTLEFWYATNGSTAIDVKALWNGNTLLDYIPTDDSLDQVWQHATFSVMGSGTDTLSFTGYANGWNGIDDVSLTLGANVVPEPSSLVMLGLAAVSCTGYCGWRRKMRT